MGRYRVTVDTGGTFSDFVYLNEETGEVSISKVPSTPDDPSRAILHASRCCWPKACAPTTSAISVMAPPSAPMRCWKARGVATGLLVTEGFRAVYPVGEQARPYGPAIFDVMFDKPSMLVPASATGEVRERVDFRGDVLLPLDEITLRETLRKLKDQKVQSIAVCLLFSFLHPQHEQRVGEIIREELPGVAISLSSEILPQIREYYRLSTTVINALPAADPCPLHRAARAAADRRGHPHQAEIHHAVERRYVDLSPLPRRKPSPPFSPVPPAASPPAPMPAA